MRTQSRASSLYTFHHQEEEEELRKHKFTWCSILRKRKQRESTEESVKEKTKNFTSFFLTLLLFSGYVIIYGMDFNNLYGICDTSNYCIEIMELQC